MYLPITSDSYIRNHSWCLTESGHILDTSDFYDPGILNTWMPSIRCHPKHCHLTHHSVYHRMILGIPQHIYQVIPPPSSYLKNITPILTPHPDPPSPQSFILSVHMLNQGQLPLHTHHHYPDHLKFFKLNKPETLNGERKNYQNFCIQLQIYLWGNRRISPECTICKAKLSS